MNTFIRRVFGHSTTHKPTTSSSRDNPATIEDGSENAIRRQLVQMLLRDVLRRSGIPSEWIGCKMLLVFSGSRGHGMYVRLTIKHWDQRLMDYTLAFQKELLTEIQRFEPQASTWLHGISWELEMAESCPYTALPNKAFWLDQAKIPSVPSLVVADITPPAPLRRAEPEKSAPNNNPTQDLEYLFAIRDRELERQAASGLTPAGYEKTQPSPL